MANQIINYYIKPEDGWVAVSTGSIGFIRISAYPHTHTFYVHKGTSPPTDMVSGIAVCHKAFWANVNDIQTWYVRVPNAVASSTDGLGSLRLDVVTLAASSGGGGGGGTAYAEGAQYFQATAAGTGYSIGDQLVHIINADPTGSGIVGNFWINMTTGTQLAGTPPATDYTTAPLGAVSVSSSALPSGAATSALQTTINTSLSQLHTDLTVPLPASEIAVNSNTPQLLAQPSVISMAALNATVQWQVEPGCSHYLSLTNGPGATAQFVGTVTFQYSTNGTTWNSVNGVPLSSATAQAASSTTAVGIFSINLPTGTGNGILYLRANMTAYTSGTVYATLTPGGVNAVVPAPWTYTVTAGQTLVGPMDTNGFTEVYLQISAITTTVLTVQGTNDLTQTTWDTIPAQEVKSQNGGVLTITAAGTYRAVLAGYKWYRVQVTTTGTVLTVQGVTLRSGAVVNLSAYGSAVEAVIYSGTVTSLSQIATAVPQMNSANGSTNKELGISVASAIAQTDVSAGAFAGAGRVNGTVIASAAGSGAWVSAEINVSALTLGTATACFAVLQESRGGTNFTDIWVSDPITAASIVSMPAIPVNGRRRWSFFNMGGTSTTVTVTITALELPPMATPLIRQMRDYFAAANPFALVYNNAALAASNFVLSTISTNTTPMYVEGSKVLTAFMTLAGAPTVTTQPVVTVQGSMDGTNFVIISGATLTAAGNGTYAATVANVAYKFVRLQVTTAAAYSAGAYTISNIGVQAVS